MAKFIRIDREQVAEADCDDIEQPAIEVKVVEAKYALIMEAAAIVAENQFAVVMLHWFVVGNRVLFEGQEREDHQRGDEGHGSDITGSKAAGPPQGQGTRAAGDARLGRLRFNHVVNHTIGVGREGKAPINLSALFDNPVILDRCRCKESCRLRNRYEAR